jgi:tetratricopeptide (TPR) repeat protein
MKEAGAMRTNTRIILVVFFLLLAGTSSRAAGQARPSGNLTDPAYRNGVLRKVADLVESKYVLADRAIGFADAFRAKCAAGAYDGLTEPSAFAEKVNADLVAISGDKHLNFRVIVPSDAGEKPAGSLHHSVRYHLLRQKENTGFSELRWIEPRIGYLDLRRFYSYDQARPMALAAMTFLSNARAIIVDVRENGGGSGDWLSSYFLPYPTQLSSDVSRPAGAVIENWTIRDVGMAPRTDVPLFVLIGPHTFSAAEGFAYDLKTRKRATLVGEPTKGGAHSVDLFGIDDTFEFYISTMRSVSPVTGANWEGTGVIPDISVPAEAALDAAVAEARKAAEAFGRAEDERLKSAVERMQGYADEAARLYERDSASVSADAALDALFEIARTAGLVTEFFINVFAYNFQPPPDEGMLIAVLERAVRFFPDSAEACERLGEVHLEKGHRELAARWFERALALDPGRRNAAKRLRELRERK